MAEINSNPTVSNLTQTLDQSDDGSLVLPVRIIQTNAVGPINKNPTVGRLEQTLSMAEDGSMALPVEIVELAEDGSTFVRSSGLSNGGGGSVTWDNVLDKPTTFTPSEHNHDDRYYTKTQIDEPSFFQSRIDNVTIALSGSELTVKSVDGLQIGVAEINAWLTGTTGNIQTQINGINEDLLTLSSGMKYLGKLETYAELQAVTTQENGSLAVVLADESRTGGRSMYVYSESLGTWEFIGEFTFAEEFITLKDTPISYSGADGKFVKVSGSQLIFDNIDYSALTNKPSSTITEIDDAVTKRHEHPNADSLAKLGVNASNELTINGVVYTPKPPEPKQRLYARRTGTTQALTVGTDCVFNNKISGTIPYDTTTGLFTLEAGKTYRIFVTASINTDGFVTLRAVSASNTVAPDANQALWTSNSPTNTSWKEASAGPLLAYITPTTTGDYKIRTTGASGTSELRMLSSTLEIIEV
jgi:hypothetical protein